ncbi:hypothetical protein HJG60_008180 [Phyllostomus discolor]|uniref:Uncharacterized protein n=1 Tax=Phyllostomus discolor TaxID=89673 RepID=A0A833Z8N9_9CHIR|nr:hypothetical protein HJG60_008180 [Phyllostomus discolor]
MVWTPGAALQVAAWAPSHRGGWVPRRSTPSGEGRHCQPLRTQPQGYIMSLLSHSTGQTSHRVNPSSKGREINSPLCERNSKVFAATFKFFFLLLILQTGKGREKEREGGIDVREKYQLAASRACP